MNGIEETNTLVTVPANNQVEETPLLMIDPIVDIAEQEPPEEEFNVTVEDCERLYGVCMETAHSLFGARKDGVEHRELPDDRRREQGKILHSICKKYDIKIPTEFELFIFGGALIADWQHMSVKTDTDAPKSEPATTPKETMTDDTEQ